MNNAAFGKTMENARKHKDTKLVTTERRKNCLVSEPNYHTTKFIRNNFLKSISNRNEKNKKKRKTEILVIKPDCSGFSISELSKPLTYQF